jgi:hypothetical protein
MTVIATVAKFAAAWLTQKTFGFSVDERRLIFGLSNAQAAATLAAVLVGYNIVLGQGADGEPVRLVERKCIEWHHSDDSGYLYHCLFYRTERRPEYCHG